MQYNCQKSGNSCRPPKIKIYKGRHLERVTTCRSIQKKQVGCKSPWNTSSFYPPLLDASTKISQFFLFWMKFSWNGHFGTLLFLTQHLSRHHRGRRVRKFFATLTDDRTLFRSFCTKLWHIPYVANVRNQCLKSFGNVRMMSCNWLVPHQAAGSQSQCRRCCSRLWSPAPAGLIYRKQTELVSKNLQRLCKFHIYFPLCDCWPRCRGSMTKSSTVTKLCRQVKSGFFNSTLLINSAELIT